MSRPLELAVAAVLALAAGFAAGRLSAPDPVAAPVVVPPEPSPPEPEPVAARPYDPAIVTRCENTELELRLARARREAEQDREQVIRRTFADGTTLEQPLDWMNLAEAVAERCLPATIELRFMQCTEYPCVGVYAGPADASLAAHDELEFRAAAGLESCAPLVEAFGEGYPIDAAAFVPLPVSCPDGDDELAWALMLLDPKGDAFHDLRSDPDDWLEAARINRWIHRRVHDIDRQWICEGETPPADDEAR